MASTRRATASWYSHPVFASYRQRYHHAMLWIQSHQNVYTKFRDSYFTSPWFFLHGVLPCNSLAYDSGHPRNSQGQHIVWQESPYSVSHLKGSRQPLQSSNRTQASEALCEEEELEWDSDDEVERDLSNMEITEGLRQYIAQTERHREERRVQQQLDAECLNGYVNADHGLYFKPHWSVEPPI